MGKDRARIFRFFGISRSGNHAVIEWIIKNLNDPSLIFLNNCTRGTPTESFSYMSIDPGTGRQKHRANTHREKNRHYLRMMDAIDTAKTIVVSYEIYDADAETRASLWAGTTWVDRPADDIQIIRSPLNLLASGLTRIAKETTRPARLESNTRVFLDDMKGFYQNYLRNHLTDPTRSIIYDRWGADEAYRREILANLGIPPVDLDLGEMTTAGGGSSFDTKQDVRTISTSNRWAKATDNAYFREGVADMVGNHELMDAIAEVFPGDHAQLRKLAERQ